MYENKINLVLFDLDGVLVDSSDFIDFVFQNTIRVHGLRKCDPAEWAILKRGLTLKQIYSRLGGGDMLAAINETHMQFHNDNIHLVKAFPNAARVLETIRKNKLKIGVVTNRSQGAKALLELCKLLHLTDHVIAFEDVKMPKPDPEGILRAMDFFGSRPEESIMVGDSPIDLEAANAAGIVGIGINTGDCFNDLAALRPRCIIHDLSELLPILGLQAN